MLYVTVFVGCFVFGWILASLLSVHRCGVEYGTIFRCRALVGRRGHRSHVWEPIPLDVPIRPVDDVALRNMVAIRAEERIAMTVINPANLVRIVVS